MLRKRLRSGYTTGACAAAASKAAVLLLDGRSCTETVEIPFPDSSRRSFKIQRSGVNDNGQTAWASVIKDAGDDPDVTNGAEIAAEARLSDSSTLIIKGGKGVGVITKPGLAVGIGEPAINPVPRKMINNAVKEASQGSSIEITISVTDGEKLAEKTLNARLGIVGGISILGTTGIVRPISSDAWTATISSSMDVAKAMGRDIIVLSAGRASEKAHMKKFSFPDESYVMMGDYLEFALLDAVRHGFGAIHLCAQWAKMLKIAMATPQTHVRHGAISMEKAVHFLRSIGIDAPAVMEFNTAREIFDFIKSGFLAGKPSLLSDVCRAAKRYAEGITAGMSVTAHLVSYEGDILASSG